jgi:hypothetical protein
MKSFAPRRARSATAILAALALTLVAGCGGSQEAGSVEMTAAQKELALDEIVRNQPEDSPIAAHAAQSGEAPRPEMLTGAVHGFMTQQLHIFIQQQGRMPETFLEFANARMDSVPAAPPGFRYDIDRQTIQVKLLRQ